MAGRRTGSKNKVRLPSSYDVGTPAVNFYLAILRQAKADEDINWETGMWVDFQKTELYKRGRNVDPVEVAEWVSEYIKED